MDLSAYLLDRAIAATTPPGEAASAARTRAEAIAEMLRAYAPGSLLETMMACQCIMMQFLLDAAMRDASNPHQEPQALAKARAGAISASRTLQQWVTKFENQRKRNDLQAAQAAKAEAAAQPTLPEAPKPQPVAAPAAARPAQNARVPVTALPLDPLPVAAPAVASMPPARGISRSGAPHDPPPSVSVAA